MSLDVLGTALLVNERAEEALLVLEADLALKRRYWSDPKFNAEDFILVTQKKVVECLNSVGRLDEALVCQREIYERHVGKNGVSHERTIRSGSVVAGLLIELDLWNEAKTLWRNLLRAARRSLGEDHDITLSLYENLASALILDRENTRDNLCV